MSVEQMTNNALRAAGRRLEAQGITYTVLAARLGLPTSTVASWFRRRTMGLGTLLAIAEAVDMDPAVLLMSPDQVSALQAVDGGPGDALVIERLLRGTHAR